MIHAHDEGASELLMRDMERFKKTEDEFKTTDNGWSVYRGEYVDLEATSESNRSPNVKDIANRYYNPETGVPLRHPLELMSWITDTNQWADLAVRTIAANCSATTPLFRIITQEKGRNKRVKASAAAEELIELFNNPNPLQTGYQMFNQTFLDLAIYGNAYWQIVKNRAGKIHSIYCLPAENMRVVPGIDKDLNLHLGYWQLNIVSPQYKKESDKNFKQSAFLYTESEIVHFKMPNERSAVYGKPPLYTQITQITTNQFAQNAINTWFNEGWMGGAIFRLDGDPETVRRNREFLKEMYSGSENMGRIMLLGGKTELIADGNKFMANVDFEKLMRIGKDSILNCMGVPLSMAGVRSKEGTINSELVASEESVFKRNVIDFYHNIVFGQITKKLLRGILGIKNLEVQPGTLSKFNLKYEIDAVRALGEFGISIGEVREFMGMTSDKIDEKILSLYLIKTNNGAGKTSDVLGADFESGEIGKTIYERQRDEDMKFELTKMAAGGLGKVGGKQSGENKNPIGGKTSLPKPSAAQLGLGGDLKNMAEGS